MSFLQTTQGDAYPDSLFLNETDKIARSYLMTMQQNVILFEGSPYVLQNDRPHLTNHIQNLMDSFLSQAIVSDAFDKDDSVAQKFVIETGRKILCHDDDETIGETRTFQQKSDPFAPKLNSDDFEAEASYLSNSIAQKYAAQDNFSDFRYGIYHLQDNWKKSMRKISALKGDKHIASMNDLFSYTLKNLKEMHDAVDVTLDPMQKCTTSINQGIFRLTYRDCEETKYRNNSASGLLAKIIDKSGDEFYTLHGRKKLADYRVKGKLIERENSALTLKTIMRPFDYLPRYNELVATSKGLEGFSDMAIELVTSKMKDYVLLAQPILALRHDEQKSEPDHLEKRPAFLEHCLKRQEILVQRRQDIHALEDSAFITSQEAAAKLLTLAEYPECITQAPFDVKQSYSDDFVASFDRHLSAMQCESVLPRHPNYII